MSGKEGAKKGPKKGQRRCQRRGQGARLKSALAVSEFYECRRFYVHAHTSSCLFPTPSSSQVDFSQPAKELRPPRDDGGPVSQLGDCKWKLRAWRDFVTSHFIGYVLASICFARAAVLHYINRPRTTYCIKGPHGLTPPLKNVRRKRFRKTAKKQADDNPRSRITQASTSNSRRTHTHTHHTTVVRVVQVVGSGDTRKRNGRCPPFCQPRPIDMLTCARLR